MSATEQLPDLGQVGWRFAVGVLIVVGGYAGWAAIPVVASSDAPIGVKTALSGFLAVLPILSKIAAIAVMGKPGFKLLKYYLFKFLGRLRPADQVSRPRYRFGLALFVLAIVFGTMLPYLPGRLIDWRANEQFWSLVSDAVLIASLFVLGGDFWNKLAALFDYNAKVVVRDGEAA